MGKITVIKACKRENMWDYNNNCPIEDDMPIGHVMNVYDIIPESYIRWHPNKIFDKRKYPELYKIFGKDHLPTELELRCYVQKHFHEWNKTNTKNETNKLTESLYSIIVIVITIVVFYLLIF